MTFEEFLALFVQMRELIDDKGASVTPDLYRSMHYDGSLIKAGSRINFNGVLHQAAVDLWDREENAPDIAPSLWVKIEYVDGCRIIPDPISAAEAFALGERGYWDGHIYESIIPSNVWTPEQYPQGWTLIE